MRSSCSHFRRPAQSSRFRQAVETRRNDVAADQTLTAVPVKLAANSFQADVAKPLFALPPGFNFFVTRIYAASHDGQRFLVPAASGGSTTPLTVVLNWQTGLKK